jgi:RHS repeat-associated protein
LNRIKTVSLDSNWLGMTAEYDYDTAGRLARVDNFNRTWTSFGYDNADRLTDIQNRKADLTAISTWHFILDKNGNRLFTDKNEPLLPAVGAGATAYTYNTQKNRLLTAGSSSFSYDNEGQLSSRSGTSYTFDYEHRLKSIGSSYSYFYDGMGKRLKASRNGVQTRYIYDQAGNLLAEANGSNVIQRYYIYGQGLLAMVTSSGQIYCYHFNAIGSTIAVTDSTQNIVNKYAYTPFGGIANQQEAVAQPFKFVGQYGVMAEPNGLYYMRARYYDPSIGRFISEDPSGFGGGDVNLYAYVQNNPVIFIDPFGLERSSSFSRMINSIPIPDVRIGIDSPVGGATMTLPFSTGGQITATQTKPSWNIPIGLGMNAQFGLEVDQAGHSASVYGNVTTPLSGLSVSTNIVDGQISTELAGPQWNFPVAPGTNAYIGVVWQGGQ